MVALESVIFQLHMTESHNIQDAIGPATIALQQRKNFDPPKPAQIMQTAQVLSVYHVLFIVAQIFQLVLLCDAV